MIVNGMLLSLLITVPIIVSVLFTTSIHVDLLSSSLKIQYTIIHATTRKLDTDTICVDLNGDMYTMLLYCLVHKSTIIYYSPYYNIHNGKIFLPLKNYYVL